MTLSTRRFLYISFILAFLIITPIVILYANGYTFSLKKQKIVKTGMLVVDTKPTGANIYLNGVAEETFLGSYFGKKTKITTPTKIKNIVPGEYLVRLELPNYWPWEKKLTINSGQSTYAEDIVLFKKNSPQLLFNNTQKIFLSPDNKFFLAYNNKDISLINLINGEIIKLQSASSSPVINWSPDGTKFLINNKIYRLENLNEVTSLDKESIQPPTNIKWNLSQTDVIYYKDFKNNIYSYNITSKISRPIFLEQNITGDYLIKDKYLFSLSNIKNDHNLIVADIKNSQTIKKIKLPSVQNLEFTNINNNLINLYDKDREILYLIDPFADYLQIKEIINNIKITKWVNQNKLLYANDFEIWLFDLNLNKKTLLSRLSSNIKDVVWHPSNNYIIYSTDDSVNTLELDERDKFGTIELFEGRNISSLFLDPKGENIYILGNINNQEGIFKLAI